MNFSGEIAIVGAGPVGSLLATYLAQRKLKVTLFEGRPDLRDLSGAEAMKSGSAGRSINLAVSVRGLHALREVGLEKTVLDEAIPMRGRMMHAVDGTLTFQPYGQDEKQCIYSLSRGWLNGVLLTQAEKTGRAKVHFESRVTAFVPETGTMLVNQKRVRPDVLFGTDGAASAIRAGIEGSPDRGLREILIETLDYGYKELTLPAAPGRRHALEKNALHIWPRGTFMLIALPNADGSFTCTLFLPFHGPVSLEALHSAGAVRGFFEQYFPDTLELLPDLETEFFAHPTGKMSTIKCAPWSVGNTLLLGDAAHGIVPFFGQGMNCGFEDCSVLNALLGKRIIPEWESLFTHFEAVRKKNTDAIANMALENFIEMRDKVGQPAFLLEKAVEKRLERELPGLYSSRYSLVTFSRAPYRVAYDVGVAAHEVLSELCRGIQRAEEVDIDRARERVREKIAPLLRESKSWT